MLHCSKEFVQKQRFLKQRFEKSTLRIFSAQPLQLLRHNLRSTLRYALNKSNPKGLKILCEIHFQYSSKISQKKLRELAQLQIEERRKLHRAHFIQSLLLHRFSQYLRFKLTHRSNDRNCHTRYTPLLNIPQHKTSLYQRSVTYSAAKLFNLVPVTFLLLHQRQLNFN